MRYERCRRRPHRDWVLAFRRRPRFGRRVHGLLGYSSCRLRCGVPHSAVGCRDLTDGSWIWPEGLSHYVRVHGVVLTERFVEHAARSAWQVRDVERPRLREGADGSARLPVTYDFWKAYQG